MGSQSLIVFYYYLTLTFHSWKEDEKPRLHLQFQILLKDRITKPESVEQMFLISWDIQFVKNTCVFISLFSFTKLVKDFERESYEMHRVFSASSNSNLYNLNRNSY